MPTARRAKPAALATVSKKRGRFAAISSTGTWLMRPSLAERHAALHISAIKKSALSGALQPEGRQVPGWPEAPPTKIFERDARVDDQAHRVSRSSRTSSGAMVTRWRLIRDALPDRPIKFAERPFNSLFVRFISLFDPLGNFPPQRKNIKDLPARIGPNKGLTRGYSQYLPVDQGSASSRSPIAVRPASRPDGRAI